MKQIALTPNLKVKMTLAFSFLLLLLVAGIIAAGYQYILQVSKQNAALTQEQLMEKNISLIDTYFSEMKQAAQQIAADSRIMNLFARLQENKSMDNYFDLEESESTEVSSILTTYVGTESQLWRIQLYNQYGDYIYEGNSLELRGRLEEHLIIHNRVLQVMDDLLIFEDHIFLSVPERDRWSSQQTEGVCSLLYPISSYNYSEAYGVIEVQREISQLESLLALDVQNIDVYVFDNQGNQVFPKNRDFTTVDNSSYNITTRQSSQYGWTVSLSQSSLQITQPYKHFFWYLLAAGIGLVLLIIVAIYIISSWISEPVAQLSNSIEKITFNNLDENIIDLDRSSISEVRQLHTAFATMLKRLKASVVCEKQAYLLALQSQMNPHFLYNALSVINALSLTGRNDEVSNACEKLSSMLRYSTSFDTDGIMLKDEINHIQNYLEFMKLRFQNQLTYEICVDSSLMSMPMPKLVLQPIVENCFGHGFKSVLPPWFVSVKISREDENWCIRIEDNGYGISQEAADDIDLKISTYLNNIPENYNEMKIGGLGLVNTIIRLKLALNGDLKYSIKSKGGTQVELKGCIHNSLKPTTFV